MLTIMRKIGFASAEREGEMGGETYMEGGGRAARERESDGGEETWKSIFIVGELSRQQWM